jgi:hypothetical protein
VKFASIRALWLAGLLTVPPAGHAQALLLEADRLPAQLKAAPACCVVDARGEAARRARPLPGALAWSPELVPPPGGPMILIGETDAVAHDLARRISRGLRGKQVIAVKGGAEAWRQLVASGGTAGGFVIPRNTCEQGKPLQKLRFDVKGTPPAAAAEPKP